MVYFKQIAIYLIEAQVSFSCHGLPYGFQNKQTGRCQFLLQVVLT